MRKPPPEDGEEAWYQTSPANAGRFPVVRLRRAADALVVEFAG